MLALGVMALAAVTDMLDGIIARRRGVSTAGMGSWLDPICDKLFVGAVLAALHFERGVPLSLLALIVARELMQLPMVRSSTRRSRRCGTGCATTSAPATSARPRPSCSSSRSDRW